MNPERTFGSVRSGDFVAQYIDPIDGGELAEEAIQPNGVDLSIGELKQLEGKSVLQNDEYEKATRRTVELDDGYYPVTDDTAYVIIYGEKITIPENHIGLVFPRSRLMRCGVQIRTAVWDSGYSGIGEGGLDVWQDADLAEDLRVAQMVFIRTEELEETYDGSHQGERID